MGMGAILLCIRIYDEVNARASVGVGCLSLRHQRTADGVYLFNVRYMPEIYCFWSHRFFVLALPFSIWDHTLRHMQNFRYEFILLLRNILKISMAVQCVFNMLAVSLWSSLFVVVSLNVPYNGIDVALTTLRNNILSGL